MPEVSRDSRFEQLQSADGGDPRGPDTCGELFISMVLSITGVDYTVCNICVKRLSLSL